MPIEFAIDHAKRPVHARAGGQVTLADIEAFLDAVVIGDALPLSQAVRRPHGFGKYDDES